MALLAVALLGGVACARQQDGGTPAGGHGMIRVSSPAPGAMVASPLRVVGEARGPWFFEASFPVRLLDAAGRAIAVGQARARGEWTTERFVPFEATLHFRAPASGTSGTLVLERDNPSGLPENADEIRVPVRF
jgi:Immunoglobulin-like domain of bacterial spore germination